MNRPGGSVANETNGARLIGWIGGTQYRIPNDSIDHGEGCLLAIRWALGCQADEIGVDQLGRAQEFPQYVDDAKPAGAGAVDCPDA